MDIATREKLLMVVGSNRDGWMRSFFIASSAIAKAVADGRISDDEIMTHVYSDRSSARNLAHKAGLSFDDDDDWPVGPEGFGTVFDGEDVEVTVRSIRGLMEGDAGIDEGVWYIGGQEYLYGLTIDELRTAMRSCQTAREAAVVMVQGDERWRARDRSRF